MQKSVRQAVIENLWQTWRSQSADIEKIEAQLAKRGVAHLVIDHLAIIDLPSPHSGINELQTMFSAIGYKERGRGYLADKQNDFLWMAEEDALNRKPHLVLPQIVIADFRLHELPQPVRAVIEKYTAFTKPFPLSNISQTTPLPDITAAICNYLNGGRDWPLPTVQDFKTVHTFNELLAWVLIFGRIPNHFTLSIHLMAQFNQLADFNQFLEEVVGITLNKEGGAIKGGPEQGIAQSSTKGTRLSIQLADGTVSLPASFTEFVWRYPVTASTPRKWGDYFTHFIAQHADYVIESLYVN